jgi:hypothetical protein
MRSSDGDIIGGQRMRDDQEVPIFVVNAETEAWGVTRLLRDRPKAEQWLDLAVAL